jgi:hypothetical protein
VIAGDRTTRRRPTPATITVATRGRRQLRTGIGRLRFVGLGFLRLRRLRVVRVRIRFR